MTDVNVTYTVKTPDEQFLDSFSDNATKDFTYTGPEVLTITVSTDGTNVYTQKLDGPVYPGESTVTINVTTNPELLPIADLLWGRPYNHELTFDEEDLGGGVTYQIPNNDTIHDWFWQPRYDVANDGWFMTGGVADIHPIFRDSLSPKMRTYLAKADMFIQILGQFALDTATAAKLTAYKTAVETYRSAVAMPWKYAGQNPFELTAPAMPIELISQIQAIQGIGATNLQSLAADEIAGTV
jgi:hypothetical protein